MRQHFDHLFKLSVQGIEIIAPISILKWQKRGRKAFQPQARRIGQ
jgi:hypothetical protein